MSTPAATATIAAAMTAGHLAEAERLARAELGHRPDDGDLLLMLALSLHLQKKLDQATPVYARLTQLFPESDVHWSNYATALRESGELDAAARAYATALQCNPDNAETLLNLGLLQLEQEQFVAARETLLDAHLRAPDAVPIRIHAARACAACRDSQVDKLLQPWRSWGVLPEDLTLELAHLLMTQGDARAAEELLEGLLARTPGQQQAELQLAAVYERMNRLDDAASVLRGIVAGQLVLDDGIRKEIAHQQAKLAQRRGDLAAARALLERTGPADAADYVHYFALAEVCDKLGDSAAAMAALAMAHARQIEEVRLVTPSRLEEGAPILPAAVGRVTSAEYAAWPQLRSPDAQQSPVFIVGFPRSGTTLLEQMLDAHPGLQSMDERPFFNILSDGLANYDVHVPDGLPRLNQRDCDELRKHYWSLVCEKVQRDWNAQMVDKNPLNMLWLPLIMRLFPHAKFILALRHPCDVLVSCYMQNFRSTVLASACASLDRLARAYVTAMEHWLYHVGVFQPDVLVSRYEDLVTDFPAGTRRIADFLGLADAAPLEQFDAHARAKAFIGTPSYDQVIRPVNTKAMNRWLRYRNELAPVLPILAPMLEHWGYSAGPAQYGTSSARGSA